MAEGLPHRDGVLTGRAELWPVRGDGRVRVKQAAARQASQADRQQALADREHVHQRVLRPIPALLRVRPTAPQVGYDGLVERDADCCAKLAPFPEIRLELRP